MQSEQWAKHTKYAPDTSYITPTTISQHNPLYLCILGRSLKLPWQLAEYSTYPIKEERDAATGKNFRLPTEAEWEFAARGGNNSRHYKFSGSNNLDEVAWFGDNSNKTTHDVATKQPNELGIYDMSGNVEEWCQDGCRAYTSKAQCNPFTTRADSYRALRGGNRLNDPWVCRTSYRSSGNPESKSLFIGLRLVLSE